MRPIFVAASSVALFLGLGVISLLVGAREVPLGALLDAAPQALGHALFPHDSAPEAKSDSLVLLLATHRIPRTLLAVIAGLALGGAGALMQGYARNPLADPGILGVNSGAAAGVAIAVAFGIVSTAAQYVVPALIGATLSTLLLFGLVSLGRLASSPFALILGGMAMSTAFMAFVNVLTLRNDAVLSALVSWSTGSLAGRDISAVYTTVPMLVCGLLIAVWLAKALDLLSLGEEMAASLGINVRFYQVVGMLNIALLSAVAVAAAGPVGFVGLAAPHIVRGLTGPDHRILIPLSVLIGGLMALIADVIGRSVVPGGELPMGTVLAMIGVPIFIWLIKRGKVTGKL